MPRNNFGTTIQQAVATEGLVEVLKRLRTVSNEMIGTTLGRIRANRAFGIIKTDMATIEESVIELMNREGQTAEKLAIQEKTLAFQTAQLREEWQFLMRAMGEGVASTKIVPGLKAIVKEFGLVLERNRELNAIIDRGRNAIVVGREEDVYADELIASEVNYIDRERPTEPIEVKAKIRYSAQEAETMLTLKGKDKVQLKFRQPQRAITPGQAVVFYRGDEVVGGGTISSSCLTKKNLLK